MILKKILIIFRCFALLDGLPGAEDPIPNRKKQPM